MDKERENDKGDSKECAPILGGEDWTCNVEIEREFKAKAR